MGPGSGAVSFQPAPLISAYWIKVPAAPAWSPALRGHTFKSMIRLQSDNTYSTLAAQCIEAMDRINEQAAIPTPDECLRLMNYARRMKLVTYPEDLTPKEVQQRGFVLEEAMRRNDTAVVDRLGFSRAEYDRQRRRQRKEGARNV